MVVVYHDCVRGITYYNVAHDTDRMQELSKSDIPNCGKVWHSMILFISSYFAMDSLNTPSSIINTQSDNQKACEPHLGDSLNTSGSHPKEGMLPTLEGDKMTVTRVSVSQCHCSPYLLIFFMCIHQLSASDMTKKCIINNRVVEDLSEEDLPDLVPA